MLGNQEPSPRHPKMRIADVEIEKHLALCTPVNSDKNEKGAVEGDATLHIRTTTANYPKLIRAPVPQCVVCIDQCTRMFTDEEMSERMLLDVRKLAEEAEAKAGSSSNLTWLMKSTRKQN